MCGVFVKGALTGVVCAVVGGVGGLALAGSGVGSVFNLGQTNSVDADSMLNGSTNSPLLEVRNGSSGTNASGLTARSAGVAAVHGVGVAGSAGVFGESDTGLGVRANSKASSSPALQARNNGGGPAGAFLGSTSSDLVQATNNGSGNGLAGTTGSSGNGVFGRSSAGLASGVYGQNSGGGYGIAGRTGSATRGAVFGENTGSGPALELHTQGAAPMTVDSSAKVDLLNADLLDGKDSTDFAQGRIYTLAVSFPHDQSYFPNPAPAPGFFEISANCTLDSAGNYVNLTVTSQSTDPVSVISISDIHPYALLRQRGDAISYQVLAHGVPLSLFIQGTPGGRQTVATANVGLVYRTPEDGNDCHFQIQTLTSQQ